MLFPVQRLQLQLQPALRTTRQANAWKTHMCRDTRVVCVAFDGLVQSRAATTSTHW